MQGVGLRETCMPLCCPMHMRRIILMSSRICMECFTSQSADFHKSICRNGFPKSVCCKGHFKASNNRIVSKGSIRKNRRLIATGNPYTQMACLKERAAESRRLELPRVLRPRGNSIIVKSVMSETKFCQNKPMHFPKSLSPNPRAGQRIGCL